MDKFMSLGQLVMSICLFLATIVLGLAHAIMGTIGLFGILVALFIAYLMQIFVRDSWHEYQEERNK